MDARFERLRQALSDRYTVGRELGRSWTAPVYLAEGVRHGRKDALKVVSPEFAAMMGAERFLREIGIAVQLTPRTSCRYATRARRMDCSTT